MLSRRFTAAALFVCLTCLGVAQDRETLLRSIRERLDALRLERGFPGMTAAFVLKDGTTGEVAVGMSDLDTNTPMKVGDRMLAGSIGKTYLAALVLREVEAGNLSLDDKLSKFLGDEPWFSRLPNANEITLRNLMNHSSGVPEHVTKPDFIKALKESPDRVWKPSELAAFVFDDKPVFAPGAGFSYADTNYILLGIAYEKKTGKEVYAEAQRVLLEPLGLNQTSPSTSRKLLGLVQGHSAEGGPFGLGTRMIKDGQFVINPQMEWMGGGFISAAQDLALWAKALFGAEVLKPATRALMVDAAIPANTGRGDKYGFGVQVRESAWGVSLGHGGWFPGYLSEMEYFPEHGVAIAVQFNTDNFRLLRGHPRSFVAEVAKIVLGG